MILGTISAVDNDNGLQLIIDGEDSPTTKKYTYMASYVPTANDRVIIEEISGSYVIMGKVINEYNASGIVRQADNATNATNAINATNATNATNAENATTAASCTGNAATATTAESCSGNAATATTAASCSGNAATATTSDKTKGFDSSVRSVSGYVVTTFSSEYSSVLGKNIITSITLGPYGSPQNFVYK